jgi:hypothetical protein
MWRIPLANQTGETNLKALCLHALISIFVGLGCFVWVRAERQRDGVLFPVGEHTVLRRGAI